jgi:predicted MFS family arabinose efflux permease
MKNEKLSFGVILLLGLTIGFVFMDRQAIAYLFPTLVNVFGLTNAQVGQIGMYQTLGFAIFAVVFSVISDKLGSRSRKRWLIPLLIVTSIFSGLSGIVPTIGVLLVIRFLTGATEGPAYPFMYSLVYAGSSDRQKYATNIGLVMAIHTLIAGMLGPILVTQFAVRFDWRFAFMLVSVPALVLAILLGIVVKEGPSKNNLQPNDNKQEKAEWRDFGRLLKYRNIILASLIYMCGMGALWIFITFSPLYFVKVGGMSEQSMGILMAFTGVSVLFWSFFVPFISNKIGRTPAAMLFALLAIIPFVALYLSTGLLTRVIVVLLIGILMAFGQLFIAIIAVESVPGNLRATASAFVMAFGEIVGGAVAPRIFGGLADSYGLPIVMVGAASCMAAAFLLSIFVLETNPRSARQSLSSIQAISG